MEVTGPAATLTGVSVKVLCREVSGDCLRLFLKRRFMMMTSEEKMSQE